MYQTANFVLYIRCIPRLYHCRCDIYSLRIANYLKNFIQTASTRCSGSNKEKLSPSIRSEHASDICHDRKSALRSLQPLFTKLAKSQISAQFFVRMYVQGLYTYFESAQVLFSLYFREKGGGCLNSENL